MTENYSPKSNTLSASQRLTIRIGDHTIDFLKPKKDGSAEHLPYVTKSGMSVSANLRLAFREEEFLADEKSKVLLSVCSPVSLVPIDEYMDEENFNADELYDYVFTGHEHEEKVCNVLPDFSAVAVFGINKDVNLVINDRFSDVRIQNVMQPVWAHLYRRSMLVQQRRKLYGYFHDGILDIFSFQQRRFRYTNSFPIAHAHDAMYYLLFIWKQLAFDNENDEMQLVGDIQHQDWLIEKLNQYLRRVYVINPVADLNRSAVSQIKNIPYDLML